MPEKSPRKRANGEASRARILDAATEIASERGYEGTSIAVVSKRCGLPASSIYWHFADKDDLIAAVIERSFGQWLAAWTISAADPAAQRVSEMATQVAKALQDSPDFLRLGLMLALERRPVEPRAREMFLSVRHRALAAVRETVAELAPGLSEADRDRLATYAMAGADGLFIAKEIGGDAVDLLGMFELHGRLVVDAALRLAAGKQDQ
ncbi:TetR/AcrR family transcriptional regulator [Rhodococcoides corynebacterioides]|uniref:TetR/AcrR family transcriptional regulator n=1 Tax=Rhodococcoides corynebacterioides TaxID=53972 RepID=UPI001C9B04BB|nr:TetR/AcrR family transcriptional regulator [Rhodococcus corynebacterioides]MBY6364630.1 TetR/AcrR family transcriptional regulator [Rhodococcus corynebacterioides]